MDYGVSNVKDSYPKLMNISLFNTDSSQHNGRHIYRQPWISTGPLLLSKISKIKTGSWRTIEGISFDTLCWKIWHDASRLWRQLTTKVKVESWGEIWRPRPVSGVIHEPQSADVRSSAQRITIMKSLQWSARSLSLSLLPWIWLWDALSVLFFNTVKCFTDQWHIKLVETPACFARWLRVMHMYAFKMCSHCP